MCRKGKPRIGLICCVSLLVLVEIFSIFLMYKSFTNKDIVLDDVDLVELLDNDMFAIMIEQSDGTYAESKDSIWPTDKIYNEEMSGCIDKNGNKIDNALLYDSTNNITTIETENTSHCYLYFDLQ